MFKIAVIGAGQVGACIGYTLALTGCAGEIDLMDDCYALPVTHRAWMALRSESQPKHCERFRQFRQLCEACAQWARE